MEGLADGQTSSQTEGASGRQAAGQTGGQTDRVTAGQADAEVDLCLTFGDPVGGGGGRVGKGGYQSREKDSGSLPFTCFPRPFFLFSVSSLFVFFSLYVCFLCMYPYATLPFLSQRGGKGEEGKRKKGIRRKGWNHARYTIAGLQKSSRFVSLPCSLTLPSPECLLIAASLPSRRPWLPCVRERPSGQAPSTGSECAFGHGLGGFEDQKDADLLSRGCRVAVRTSGCWGGREREKESTEGQLQHTRIRGPTDARGNLPLPRQQQH